MGADLKLLRPRQTMSPQANLVFELVLHQGRPITTPPEERPARPLEVNVLCTSVRATVRAVKKAVDLARGLNAHLRLLVAQVVPYAVPLETPPVLVEFQEALFGKIARDSGVEARVDILLCRDSASTFTDRLAPGSVVVLGAPKRWWPTREDRVARRLRRAGHEVVMVYEGNSHA